MWTDKDSKMERNEFEEKSKNFKSALNSKY